MVVGIEELIKIVQQNDIKNFEVRSTLSDSNSTQLRTDEKQTPQEKINLLRAVMSNNYGRFHLLGYDTQSQAKGRMDIEFMIREEAAHEPARQEPQRPQMSAVPEGYISKTEVEQMLENVTLKNELSGLKSQVEDLKKEKKELETPVNEFFKNLAPIASVLAQGLISKHVPAMAQAATIGEVGADPEQEQAINEKIIEQNKIDDLLDRWETEDPEALEMLKKIVELCENNRAMYDTAKNMLKNM